MNYSHEQWMQHCIRLAAGAMEKGNPPVGSVIVFENKIVGEGEEEAHVSGDVTDHAEIIALRKIINKLDASQRAGATLYSTHEPCVMCAYAIRHYGIGRVVFGRRVPFAGGFSSVYNILSDTSHPAWRVLPVIEEGICNAACMALSEEYEKIKSRYK